MNERIIDLYEQASSFASEEENPTKSYKDRVMAKFAQLIVRECFEVVIKDHRFNDCKGIIQGAAAVAKEHFGVEE